MEIRQDFDKLFKQYFSGDLLSLSVFAYLGTITQPGKPALLSLREISKKTGVSRPRLKQIIVRLTAAGLMSSEVVLCRTRAVVFIAEAVVFGPFKTKKSAKLLEIIEKSRRPLTPFLKIVNSDFSDRQGRSSPLCSASATREVLFPSSSSSSFSNLNQAQERSKNRTSGLVIGAEITPAVDGSTSRVGNTAIDKPAKPKKQSQNTAQDLEIAKAWLEYALSEMTWGKPPKAWNDIAFATAIAKIRKSTGLTFDGVRAVLSFVRDDDFWSRVALSPSGLLRKTKGKDLRKIDYILLRMRTKFDKDLTKIARWKDENEEDAF